jgi:hypothetical protein
MAKKEVNQNPHLIKNKLKQEQKTNVQKKPVKNKGGNK